MVWEDNLQAIMLAADPLQYHARNKHIDVRHHYIRDKVADGQVVLRHCPTGDMVADMLTKPLSRSCNLYRATAETVRVMNHAEGA